MNLTALSITILMTAGFAYALYVYFKPAVKKVKQVQAGKMEKASKTSSSPSRSLSLSPEDSPSRLTSSSQLTGAAGKKGKPFTMRPAIFEMQGRRRTMEDTHNVIVDLGERESSALPDKFSLFGVYDGHGGSAAAEFVSENLPKYVAKRILNGEKPETALSESIIQLEADFLEMARERSMEDGTTLVAVLVTDGRMIVANLGDSEAILCRGGNAEVLSTVHTPAKNEKEVARVKADGGKVVRGRVGHPNFNEQYFNLAVSRAIGDMMYKHDEFTNGKKSGVIAIPEVRQELVSDDDSFLVLACDGVWDVLSYEVWYFIHACTIFTRVTADAKKSF